MLKGWKGCLVSSPRTTWQHDLTGFTPVWLKGHPLWGGPWRQGPWDRESITFTEDLSHRQACPSPSQVTPLRVRWAMFRWKGIAKQGLCLVNTCNDAGCVPFIPLINYWQKCQCLFWTVMKSCRYRNSYPESNYPSWKVDSWSYSGFSRIWGKSCMF